MRLKASAKSEDTQPIINPQIAQRAMMSRRFGLDFLSGSVA